MSYLVRRMCDEDIPQVNEIDREAFPTQWPPPNYERELHNRLAHYIVALDPGRTAAECSTPPPLKNGQGLFPRLMSFFTHERPRDDSTHECIVGFAGIWILADEAHLTNIAVRQSYQRRGIGESLLIAVFGLAAELKGDFVTLEVRASNTPAQNLYHKYGFNEAGVRRGYYTDNREDGIIMTTASTASPEFQSRLNQLKQAYCARYGALEHRLVEGECRTKPGG